MRTILTSLVAALAIPAAAAAGGWATAGLAPPGDVRAGETWHAEITVLQHGRTPLEGVHPSITLHGPDGPAGTFVARATPEPGVYAADVVFPTAGTYRYEVDDGFSRVHTFAPVEVGPAAGGSGLPGWAAVPIVAAATGLAGTALLLVLRRRARVPAAAAALD